ncbi:MAG: MBL fold metallo-hydrolase [Proteobacteria bacterium]|nr:MBL fold metallo-hydrolase [Pseudomonadota bacterium]MBU1612123.1 MBL fold metallo-hydrolase [Pseudomonadota bacterium]
MKITFLGAAGTVTGSSYLLECCGTKFMLDCGLFQGNSEMEKRNFRTPSYDPKDLDFILITHAHIDHTGLLPRLVQKGFSGPIYASEPTLDLMEIMLLDSAHIQEMEAEWANRKTKRTGGKMVNPLYTSIDAESTLSLIRPVTYEKTFEPVQGVRVTYRDAGHILGSAFIRIEYEEDGKTLSMLFSGDLGRPDQLIVNNPSIAKTPDYLFLESTYGNRDHKDESNSLDELANAIDYAYSHGEKVVIPAFAVERSQQIIYTLHLLASQGRLPADMPVYLDSPMAIRATEVFKKHPGYADKAMQDLIAKGENPFDLPNLRYTLSTEDSKAINETPGAAVVISASGMCNAGRIKHHLRHNLWRPGAAVVFVGYQAMGTLGRKLVGGSGMVRIFGEEVAVAAKIFTIGGFSGHAGQKEILDWVSHFKDTRMKVFLVHGEPKAQRVLSGLLKEKFDLAVHIADYLEEVVLEPDAIIESTQHPELARPGVDWGFLLKDSGGLYEELIRRVERVKGRSWEEQVDFRDRLLEVNRLMVALISEM